ncbi:MAG TPA: hypothetical protein VHW09_22575 [Bryobacteraceae bacterium]|nr:hypothetical protein [Bryobacteraceae bacterium]
MDRSRYEQLRAQAQKVGCRSILLAPKAGQIAPKEDTDRKTLLQFVDLNFGRTLNPYMTPQTLLLDGLGEIIWEQEGSIDESALSAGIRRLRNSF